MATGVAGDSARLFPWQMQAYIVRGGPNDPVLPATGGPPVTGGGVFSWNSAITFPPIPGVQPPLNRSMTIQTTGAGNIGGILIGTIPQGAWITGLQLFVYTAFTGGTPFIGVMGVPANTAYPPTFSTTNIGAPTLTATSGIIGQVSGAATGLFGSPAGNGIGALTGNTGFGPTIAQAGDVDLYAYISGSANAGSAGAAVAGSAAIWVSFSGLEG
jgi:hypothetical protein